MANLELKNVRKTFGTTDVIRGVDLKVEHGEFVVFVGPSGSGKSTLLRLIAGLEALTEGSLVIDGADVTGKPPLERGVAMVFQSYALYPHMTVAENIGFGLRIAREPKDVIRSKVQAAAEVLKLDALLDRKPKALSGGQRQRVAIGRAIVKQPKIFLFDEPLSNLDAELRVQMRLEIARLHQDLGATMVYVTHDQVEAMTLADKIVVLRDGAIEQVGAPVDLYLDPDNEFVAGFVGSPRMNFLPCDVSFRETGMGQARLADLATPLAVKVRGTGQGGGSAKLGFRPEHVEISEDGLLTATIRTVERLGSTSFLHAQTEQGCEVTLEHKGLTPCVPGETIRFTPVEEFRYLFDESGNRI